MKKYEYRVVQVKDASGLHLNEFGNEGWLLCAIDNGQCIFVKEIELIVIKEGPAIEGTYNTSEQDIPYKTGG